MVKVTGVSIVVSRIPWVRISVSSPFFFAIISGIFAAGMANMSTKAFRIHSSTPKNFIRYPPARGMRSILITENRYISRLANNTLKEITAKEQPNSDMDKKVVAFPI